jgi:hypothetical protein
MIDPVSVYLSSTNDWPSQCVLEFYRWLTQSVYTWVLQMTDPVVELKYTLTGSVICRTQVYTDWVNHLYNSSTHWLGQSFVELKYTLTGSIICRTQVYTDWVNHLENSNIHWPQSVYTWVLQMIDPVSVYLSSTDDWPSQCILEFYKWLTQSVYTWVLQMTDPVSVCQSFVELKYTLTGSVICRTQVYTDWVNHL